MKEFKTIDDIFDFAIKSEQEAVDFYNDLAEIAKTEDMRNVFVQFAQEEIGHKARLTKIKAEGAYQAESHQIKDLKISDYMVSVKPAADMTYSEALVLAMKKEKAAYKLYLELSKRAVNDEMKDVFLSLAEEESKHKLRFEIEYDEFVLREN
ncbi:MAG: ferritin family protein [Bacteroidales bacterium]|jgi:rubrerythrin|nr:ferritin family protein [Bacteroidales bacterium]